jgi:hypothetical protein
MQIILIRRGTQLDFTLQQEDDSCWVLKSYTTFENVNCNKNKDRVRRQKKRQETLEHFRISLQQSENLENLSIS